MSPSGKPQLLVISAVLPFPRESGQQVRVCNTLAACAPLFETTFLTFAPTGALAHTRRELSMLVDRPVVLPSITQRHFAARVYHKIAGSGYVLATSLKSSNYILGSVELSPRRIASACPIGTYDVVLYEYWHTHRSLSLFQPRGIPCVLDMHDVLWRSYEGELRAHPSSLVRAMLPQRVRVYRRREESAWARYDALIAISAGEAEYVRSVLPQKRVLLAPMGIDLEEWSYRWTPSSPARFAFYGGQGSAQNRASVLSCVSRVMPLVWSRLPDAEFWVVGANPPPTVVALQADPRVRVTGFVPDVGRGARS